MNTQAAQVEKVVINSDDEKVKTESDAIQTEDPKERILQAAQQLFAQKGYSAVGVRELASKARVNIAMISYYFGSKQGVLKELLDRFFDMYEEAHQAVSQTDDPKKQLRAFIHIIVELFQKNSRLVRIAMTELPLDAADLAKHKAERIQRFFQTVVASVHQEQNPTDPHIAAIYGPAMISMLASHFLLKPMLQSIEVAEFDEAFYQRLPSVLADMFLDGFSKIDRH